MPAAADTNTPPRERLRRPWSLYLGRLGGVPLFVHFTFFILLALVSFNEGLSGAILILAVFACVALHELGHATMARLFGIRTSDIILYPIGGVARLASLGRGMQEFWIALAGPAVNLAIAAGLFVALRLTGAWTPLAKLDQIEQLHPAQQLMGINIALMIFNLLPAFPMDGGRVVRAVLSRWLSRPRATAIAARVGQLFAAGFIVWGIVQPGQNFMLILIGFFLFSAAGQELTSARAESLATGKLARDAAITRFEVLNHGDTLEAAASLALKTAQRDFPVVNGQQVIGLLDTRTLTQALNALGPQHYVAEVMNRQPPAVPAQTSLRDVFMIMNNAAGSPVLVFEGERLLGYIDRSNLAEFMNFTGAARPGGAQ